MSGMSKSGPETPGFGEGRVDGSIPFNRPYLVGSEFERMREAVEGLVISEGGPFTDRCEQLLLDMTGAEAALLTSSCTHALERGPLEYPGLGYSSGPLSNGHNFSVESLAELIRGEPMPPCIYVLFNYPWLGGEKILGLIGFAEATPGLSAEVVEEFRDGRYVIILARIRRGDADCPV